MSDGKCVKCGSVNLNDSINARIRGGLQMISCKECGFVEFYTPNDKEKSNNVKDGFETYRIGFHHRYWFRFDYSSSWFTLILEV